MLILSVMISADNDQRVHENLVPTVRGDLFEIPIRLDWIEDEAHIYYEGTTTGNY